MGIENYTDQEIVQAILRRDSFITKEYLYRKCYPLFKSLFNRYITDCTDTVELIHEIYAYLLTPGIESNSCPLATYRSEGSLFTWLKLVALSYCYARFKKIERIKIEPIDLSDIYERNLPSLDIDMSHINEIDVECLFQMMPNKRYSRLIYLRYVKSFTNEETARALGMTMANYYNKHKLAKEQFIKIYNKEFGK